MSETQARLTRFAGESWSTALSMHARVVGALVMRDLQTRFGSGYAGFLLSLVMPLGHLGIALAILTVIGRIPPIGGRPLTFLMTGILPFVLWFYCHRQMMLSIQQNKPLLYFPGVDFFDILFARATVEIASGTLVVVSMISTLAIFGYDVSPVHLPGFTYALIAAWFLGIATGLIFASLGLLWMPLIMAGSLLGPLFWISSGVLYLPTSLPERLQTILQYFPLCQIVDGVRVAYFDEYQSSFYDPSLLFVIVLGMSFFGLALVVVARRIGSA
ncbi:MULTISPECIES: ABC transporter permease [Xanthobacter]|uniref:ABC transporter permease n=1 Tax=Xanthobacter TaxID=279 RepID=UPI00049862B9|nr:ABC transporter permease [Xanthobacter sp. 91]